MRPLVGGYVGLPGQLQYHDMRRSQFAQRSSASPHTTQATVTLPCRMQSQRSGPPGGVAFVGPLAAAAVMPTADASASSASHRWRDAPPAALMSQRTRPGAMAARTLAMAAAGKVCPERQRGQPL